MEIKLNQSRFLALLFPFIIIAPFFLWGTAMVAMKAVIPETTPLFLGGMRLLPAGVLVIMAGMMLNRSQPKGWLAWGWISLFALVDGTLFQGFLAEGLVHTGAGIGSVMIDSQPLMIAVLSSLLFADRIGRIGWLGLGLGLTGISLIGLPEPLILETLQGNLTGLDINVSSLFSNGEWLMLLAALSMAGGTILIRYVCHHVDPVMATGWHLLLGGIPLFFLSGITENQQWQNISFEGWLAILYATVCGSAIAYGIFFYLASSRNLTSFASLTFLTPIFALLFGNLLLQEQLTAIQTGGVCLTLVSIYLINQRK
ncbi:DMT family transporter [Euhalothece natronophila Z-M001]|uniref:DMT family transporter n=1 Tax=Euhalothece natronophila Z-M001 TaxID=522448 RepID=A0A5B8NKA0_9CHRO|nr:DMT family transporter [Euhalothece natronophila]QDZ39753.1 DMT family transporter [Euhalothece natronophila Z-M001]